jgi:hypothetical protein
LGNGGNGVTGTGGNGGSFTVVAGNAGTGTTPGSAGSITLATEGGNITIDPTGKLTVSGRSDLGAVGNVKITGGTTGQVLSTDGTGNLSWATAGGGGTTLPNGTSPSQILAWQYDGTTLSWQIAPNPTYWNLPINQTDAAYNFAVGAVGQGLNEGARYYNTTNEVLRVYDGASWNDAGSGVTPMTVAALGTKPQGFRSFVTDSQTPASAGFGSPVTGGGSNKTPVWTNGIGQWFIG